jgi:four helix bundle protein
MPIRWRLLPLKAKGKSEKQKVEHDLKYRCYRFSLEVIRFLRGKRWEPLSMVLVRQVMRSATSVGANVIEAKNSSTRLEFKRFYEIALKSCGETKYWLCLMRDGFEVKDGQLEVLLNEANELSRILAASILKLKRPK